VAVDWSPTLKGEFPVEIRVDTANQKGVLATVAAAISETGANIENVSMENRDGVSASLAFVVNVTGRGHLASLIRQVRRVPQVSRIQRLRS
jgi:GTP diphosphokinase / guanosine-3',5'-bis(diphosphate) 3'-diphosphatase